MTEQPKRKVGLISCSGEELPEGTLSRVAVRLVLEKLRPGQTVTLCLPLFLSGDGGERAFARTFPTIAVDGCLKACAACGTEKYSGKLNDAVVVSSVLEAWGEEPYPSRRRLDERGWGLAWRLAEDLATRVDRLLAGEHPVVAPEVPAQAAPVCACQGGGVPRSILDVDGKKLELVALEPILQSLRADPAISRESRIAELLRQVRVYNGPLEDVPEQHLIQALERAWDAHQPGTEGD